MKNGRKRTFKQELLVSFFALSVLPLAICSLFLIRLFQLRISRDYQDKDIYLAQEINEKLDELFVNFEAISDGFEQDEEIRLALGSPKDEYSGAIYKTLYQATKQYRENAWFELYGINGECLYSTKTGTYQKKMPLYWGILRQAREHPDEMVVLRCDGAKDGALLQTAKLMQDEEKTIGYFVAGMGTSEMEHVFRGMYGGSDGICILDAFWETVYEGGVVAESGIGRELRDRRIHSRNVLEDFQNTSVYVSPLGERGLYVVLLRPRLFTEDTVHSMYSVLAVMVLIVLGIGIFAAVSLSQRFSIPIRKLQETMDRVRKGHLDARVQEDWSTVEFDEMASNFNQMTVDLKQHMEQQVQQQKTLNEMQLSMMQAQLNPHFLYNTLDTVKWVAKAHQVPEIVVLVSKLAKILRSSISKKPFSTLAEEMEMVESYAEIQRIRFDGKFLCECTYEEALAECEVPRLVLQPIVENSIMHGLSESEEGTIRVRAFVEELQSQRLVVEVTDDGCGISEEVMERVNHHTWQKRSGHIGLGNVDTIIRLHYGEDYGVQVSRRPEGGTQVRLVLPVKRSVTSV